MGFLLSLFLLNSANANTLHARFEATPHTLDWTGQVMMSEAAFVVNLCEGLYTISYPSENVVPAIASSVNKSKDLTEYTFQIREDAKWSDGRAIYAKDFVDGWQRVLSPQSTSIYTYYLFDIVNAREYNSKKIDSFDKVGVHATSDRTLVVKFNHPQKNWEVTTSFWPLFPVRNDLIEKFGNSWWKAGVLVSSGPFIFSSLEEGKSVLLKRNPFYKKTVSNVDEIKFDLIADEDEALKKYQDHYFSFITGVGTEKYLKNKDFHSIPLLRLYVVSMNAEKFPFNNKDFRLSVLSSINRKAMMPRDLSQFKIAHELVPTTILANEDDLSVPYDPKKAKEYLKKSGIELGKNFKINFLTSIYEPYYSVSKNIASQIETTLGIPVDALAYQNQEYDNFKTLGEYNMLILSWTSKVRSPQDFLYPFSGGYLPKNVLHYSTEDYDHAIEAGDYKKAQTIISKENGIVYPLFFEKSGFLSHDNIKNIFFDFRGHPVLKDVILK